MTPAQFAALAKLISLRNGPAQEAARLVLVDGMSGTGAATLCGISRSSCGDAVTRVRAAWELAKVAAGVGLRVEGVSALAGATSKRVGEF